MSKEVPMKKLVSEFKAFALKGNVVSMAVGVVVGSSFTAIVNSMVQDIITPLISIVGGGFDFAGWTVSVGGAPVAIGNFINAIVSFLIVSVSMFLVVKAMSAALARFHAEEKKEEEKKPPEPSNEEKLLTEIRDLLREQTKA